MISQLLPHNSKRAGRASTGKDQLFSFHVVHQQSVVEAWAPQFQRCPCCLRIFLLGFQILARLFLVLQRIKNYADRGYRMSDPPYVTGPVLGACRPPFWHRNN